MIKPSLSIGMKSEPFLTAHGLRAYRTQLFYEGAETFDQCEPPPIQKGFRRTEITPQRCDVPDGLSVIVVDEEECLDADRFKERGGVWKVPKGAAIKHAPLIGGAEAFLVFKEALGIDPSTIIQRIVIDVNGSAIPTVYVKGPGTRRLIQAAAGLFSVVPVADVTVDENGNVETKPL